MNKCADCGHPIKDDQVLCAKCNELDDLAIAEWLSERLKHDNGVRHTLADVQEMLRLKSCD